MQTDEEQDEIATWLESPEPDDDTLVSESDYYEQDREMDIALANCEHANAGPVQVSDEYVLDVCDDCGRELGEMYRR